MVQTDEEQERNSRRRASRATNGATPPVGQTLLFARHLADKSVCSTGCYWRCRQFSQFDGHCGSVRYSRDIPQARVLACGLGGWYSTKIPFALEHQLDIFTIAAWRRNDGADIEFLARLVGRAAR